MTTTLDTGTSLARLGEYIGGSDSAATERIYEGDGRRISRRRDADPRYQRDLSDVMFLFEDVMAGSRRAAITFQESMSRSDFQFLFGDVLDRQLLGAYNTMPVQWDTTARRGRVRD